MLISLKKVVLVLTFACALTCLLMSGAFVVQGFGTDGTRVTDKSWETPGTDGTRVTDSPWDVGTDGTRVTGSPWDTTDGTRVTSGTLTLSIG